MAYPTTLDTFIGTAAQGTSLLTSPDHALDHRTLGSAVGTLEQVVGTTGGTNVLKNFLAGDRAARILANNTLQQPLIGTIQLTAGSITGQIVNTGTVGNGIYGTALYQGGTGNAMTFGTPVIDVISARTAGTGVGFINSMYPANGTLTDAAGGTLTADARAAQIYYSAMGTTAGNRTIGTPTSPSNYQQLTYAFKASGSANGTLVWSSAFRFSQDAGTPALGTGTTWNYYGWRYNAIDSKWDYIGSSKNLI